jgi:hypothetical protein
MKIIRLLYAVAALGASSELASAQTLLNTSFGGTKATNIAGACTVLHCFSEGPVAIGANGFTVTYTAPGDNSQLLSGLGGMYSLGGNGNWKGVAYAGTNEGLIRLSFASPVAMVGGFMNYCTVTAPDCGGAPWLRAFDASNMLIAEYDLREGGGIFTPDGFNAGAFRGVSYAGGISALELQGSYLITQDLYATSAMVPEPNSLALVGAGFVGVAMYRRRRA